MKMNKKLIVATVACAALLVGSISTSLAWLVDKTTDVENIFTPSDINIDLRESDGLNLEMVPGHTIEKDPYVTVKANSEKCYVFVKIDKSTAYDTYLKEYVVNGWTLLTDGDTSDNIKVGDDNFAVYCRVFEESTTDQTAYILKGADHKSDCTDLSACSCENVNGYVEVKTTVTKSQMEALKASDAVQPTLTFTAYAIQYFESNDNNFSEYNAWKQVFDENNDGNFETYTPAEVTTAVTP